MKGYVLAMGAGAAVEFFIDPEFGRRRRLMARDRALAIGRRVARRVQRFGRKVSSDIEGQGERIAHIVTPTITPNDETLRDRVESELFRDPGIPKGRINVNVEHGTVVLRGELEHSEEITAVESRTRQIPGVYEVRNLLHLTGAPQRRSA